MNCGGDPYVIEYNVRMGDPETEAVMTRIDSDLLSHLVAAAKGELAGEKIVISEEGALTVVCVSGGYPQSYGKGYEIFGSEYLEGSSAQDKIKIFHAGTTMKDGKLVTSGGRVLAVTYNGKGIEKSREEIYPEIDKIMYTNKYYRSDVGLDLLKYEK